MSATVELRSGGAVGVSCGPERLIRVELHGATVVHGLTDHASILLTDAEAREVATALLRRCCQKWSVG